MASLLVCEENFDVRTEWVKGTQSSKSFAQLIVLQRPHVLAPHAQRRLPSVSLSAALGVIFILLIRCLVAAVFKVHIYCFFHCVIHVRTVAIDDTSISIAIKCFNSFRLTHTHTQTNSHNPSDPNPTPGSRYNNYD